ncbi:UNVERIFIED_CONTAM: 5'-3' exoribonuclease 4 [Sesamum calycinum]|uniref:5'-3' exoribonuclease n=1 Tax=Sesamum calycinum TaxID=2727403 RepID=A0AAW2LR75_9LAMI
MGIPAFYRWLLERYPLSVVDVVEDSPAFANGIKIPVDTTMPNPNGFEFDNLYLDMNGIIHPCFHPENLPSPKSYDEVFTAVFKYIDRIFSLIRPRKLLYMAIDGVAPRAKMNQQRARRFRAAKDAADEASLLEKQRGAHGEKGGASVSTGLDSNVITPGTAFMELLSSALQYYVNLRMNHDPGWKGIKVILSDASVPGEGEHKIMSYIRLQRNLPGFDPNTRHCLYGLDADLIMLALATHEVHFSVLREDVQRAPPSKRRKIYKTAKGGKSKPSKDPDQDLEDFISRQKFQFVNVWVLRDYLAESLRIPDTTVKVDLERLIDDFVFMCLFVGNDFLPHVPSLEISEGAIDLLMDVYKREFVRMGGYLTDASQDFATKRQIKSNRFYPYHYAPFASDFRALDQLKIDFVLGKPFKPFDQLMGVLPAASAQALPLLYRKLMSDPSSPILDFYPTEFELDLNGRKQAWKAVCRLPFIEEERLLTEIAKVEHTLTDEERRRNTLGLDKLFVHLSHPLAAKLFTFFERNKDHPKLQKAKVKTKINPKFSGGMNGYIYVSEKPICPAEISSPLCEMTTIKENKVVFVFYKLPHFHPHIPRPPEGVSMPQKSIKKRDLLPPLALWHEKTAVGRSRFLKRPIPPKSLAGPYLAKLAHQLVSGTCVSRHEDHGKGIKRKLDDLNDNKKKRKKRNKKRKTTTAEHSTNFAAQSGGTPCA